MPAAPAERVRPLLLDPYMLSAPIEPKSARRLNDAASYPDFAPFIRSSASPCSAAALKLKAPNRAEAVARSVRCVPSTAITDSKRSSRVSSPYSSETIPPQPIATERFRLFCSVGAFGRNGGCQSRRPPLRVKESFGIG